MPHEEESDEELDDRELPDERDVDEDDEPAIVPCPYCGKGMLEESEVCPHCRNYISREDAPPQRRRPLLIVVIVLLLVGVLSGLVWLIW